MTESNATDILDRETRKPRLLREPCATCVSRPESQLRPGRLRQLVNENIREGLGLVCHETITYEDGQQAPCQPALCAWFHEKFGHRSNYQRICERLGGFTEVEPPPDPRKTA
jgi:hypothetical protein